MKQKKRGWMKKILNNNINIIATLIEIILILKEVKLAYNVEIFL